MQPNFADNFHGLTECFVLNPTEFLSFQNVMVKSANKKAATAAYAAIKNALEQISRDQSTLIELIWQKLPLYLVHCSGQDSNGNHKLKFHKNKVCKTLGFFEKLAGRFIKKKKKLKNLPKNLENLRFY